MDTFENPFIYFGTESCTAQEFRQAVREDRVKAHMRRFNVKRGDVFLMRADRFMQWAPI